MNRLTYSRFFVLAVAFLLVVAGCSATGSEQDTSFSEKNFATAAGLDQATATVSIHNTTARLNPLPVHEPMIVRPGELEAESFDDTYEALIRNHPFGKTVRASNGLVAPVDTISRREVPSYCIAGVHGAGAYDYTGYGVADGTGTFFRFNLYPDGEGNPPNWETIGILQDKGTVMTDFEALAHFNGRWYGMNNEQDGGETHQYLDDFNKSGFLAHWKLDDSVWNGSSGEVADSAGSYDGRAYGNSYVYPYGKHAGAGYFDGYNDYIKTGFYMTGQVKTLNYWVKFSSVNNSTQSMGTYYGSRRLYLGIDGSNKIFAGYGTYYIGSGRSSPNSGIKSGQWAMMTMTIDSSNLVHVYVNGEQLATFSASYAAGTNPNEFMIGARNTGSAQCFKASVDDVILDSRYWTAEDVQYVFLDSELAVDVRSHRFYYFDEDDIDEENQVVAAQEIGQNVDQNGNLVENMDAMTAGTETFIGAAVKIEWEAFGGDAGDGFDVLRSDDPNGGYEVINTDMVPVNDTGLYCFVDTSAPSCQRVYYIIRTVFDNGCTEDTDAFFVETDC